ncbi:MAG: hypothetical protein ACXVJ3_16065, partial [Ilumatobacteraceae bacterium]
TISVHPGQTTPGATAVEYLTFYNWGTGQWQQTGQTARETTASGIFYDTIQFNPLPYHQQYYAIWEVLYLGGRVIGAGWYTSYDHGPWSFYYTGPRYTSSCWNP